MSGKRILITGAAKGIGAGIARAFAQPGNELLLHFHSSSAAAEELASELRVSGASVETFCADLAKTAEIEALFAKVDLLWGGLDVAINNAGWDPGFVDWRSITPELYAKLTDMNVRGTLFCCLNEMKRMKSMSAIVNIGSVQQDTSVPGRTLYALSKGAIHAMTAQLSLEAGPLGIRINAVLPGYIEVARMSMSPEYDRDEIASGIPVRRVGLPADIGSLCVFLTGAEATFINGADFVVDGGVSCKLARSAK